MMNPCTPLPWLALRFPFLAADRLRQLGAAPAEPFVLVERAGSSLRLAAVAPQARAMGLLPGLTLADARARVPSLESAAHDPPADAAFLRRLARQCADATPTIAVEPPDSLLLEIGASAHLFGGPQALAAQLLHRFEAAGLHLAHGFGATPDAALAFALYPAARGKWQSLPVAALGLDADGEAGLRRAGLKTTGDVARLPGSAVAARFGLGAIVALARLHETARPLTPRRSLPSLLFDTRLPEPLLSAEVAELLLEALCARAARRLTRLGRGGRRFEAALFRTDGAVHRLTVESGRPTRDPHAMRRLFDERIATLADPLDPGFGYDRIALTVTRHEPLETLQTRLDEGRPGADDDLALVLDRLAIRFGPERFFRLFPVDSHIPERAEKRLPTGNPPVMGWAPVAPGDPPARPIFLFDPPEAIEVIAEVPDGPPHRFRWRRQLHRVTLSEGPERIAAQWWRLKTGALEGGQPRDYWRVEDSDGRRYWLFRRGHYGDSTTGPAWFLHGLFA